MNPGRLILLAWRNLWRNRRRTLITASTIALGFALAVISIGMGDGSHNQMIRNSIRMGDGHLTIQPEGYLETPSNGLYLRDGGNLLSDPVLSSADAVLAPRIFLQVLATTAYNALGVGLQGIDLENDPLRALLHPRLIEGAWPAPDDTMGVVIGYKMAEKLKAKIGSKIVIMAGGKEGEVESRLARVRGIFKAGVTQVDGLLILTGLPLARTLLPGYAPGTDGAAVTRLAIFLDDPDRISSLKAQLDARPFPPGTAVLDWEEMMPQVVNFIIVDDLFNYVWLAFILAMVIFGIVNTILMSALERTREFGLLRALGLKSFHLMVLVLCEALLLAIVALAVGWIIGGGAHLYFALAGLDLSAIYPEGVETAGMYMDPVIYTELSLARVTFLTGLVLAAILGSGLYPAFKAARVPPTAAMRI